MHNICVEIKCPFFTSETDKSLSCEGVAADIKTNTMRFETSVAKLEYISTYCVNYPNECAICKAISKKYI